MEAGQGGQSALRLRGVVKRYGAITAVDGLDLEVPEGTCVGLLGPNGAGKSTTMRLLTAQAIADEGELEVLGFTLPGESKQARAAVRRRAAARQPRHDADGRAEPARLRAPLPDRPAPTARRRSSARCDVANLADRRDAQVDKLSGGMRRRLLIARALVHRPRLVLLDEPTVGLDPQVRQELWALIDALRAEGVVDPDVDALHRGGRAPRRHGDDHVARQGRRRRPAADLVAEHAGAEALEVYGPPARLRRGRGRAQRAAGLRDAAHRHDVAMLGVEARRRRALPDGERRPANLEDVFVLLTGEEIA